MGNVIYKSLSFLGWGDGYRVGTDGSVWTQIKTRGRKSGNGVVSYLSGDWRELRGWDPEDYVGGRKRGYRRVRLRHEGKTNVFWVHHLVLEAFVGPCPPGMEACHFPDRNPANNRLDNLRWATHGDNCEDRSRHGTQPSGEKHPGAKLTAKEVSRMRRLYRTRDGQGRHKRSIRSLARDFHISPSQACRILLGKSWRSS